MLFLVLEAPNHNQGEASGYRSVLHLVTHGLVTHGFSLLFTLK